MADTKKKAKKMLSSFTILFIILLPRKAALWPPT